MDVPAAPYNPYVSPTAGPSQSYSPPAAGSVSPSTIAELSGTRPWVRLLAVVSWVLVAIIVGAALVMLGATAVGVGGGGGMEQGAGLAVAVMYLVFALLMIYPALRLSGFAKSIQNLERSQAVHDLVAALSEQRRVWKFYGIVTLIYLLVAVVGVAAAVVLPLLMR